MKYRCKPRFEGFVGNCQGHEPLIDPEKISQPTTALPGSDAKIVVLGERYAAGLPLFHDGDAERNEDERGRLEALFAAQGEPQSDEWEAEGGDDDDQDQDDEQKGMDA